MFIYLLLLLAIIGMDQALKLWITTHLALNETIPFLKNVMALTYVRNDGAAWSLLAGKQIFFYIVTLITLPVLAYLFYQSNKKDYWYRVGLILVMAGAIGNFIDRLHLKYVVDMFETIFINFPIFNIADASLTIGVIMIFIAILKQEKESR